MLLYNYFNVNFFGICYNLLIIINLIKDNIIQIYSLAKGKPKTYLE